ncbi:MAG: hypothetical protein KJO39_12575 [Bacteroidia bacterium]|nr:hypothetical protein [Bacteroidia bacterium]NNF31062.1 hypothetical protein [Flavobacteriaceae bacterium]
MNYHSVNPNDYIYLDKNPTLKGLAIVSPNDIGKQNVELEQNFFKKPMKIFYSISKAHHWVTQILQAYNS